MPNTRTIFKFWIMDMLSGLMYKEGSDRMIRKVNPLLGEECALPQSPEGWQQMQLSFQRNSHYWAINRSFGNNTLKFVGAGGRILRSLLYQGKGTETNVMLIVCKWDDMTGVYRLYYSGQIDFGKDGDQVTEGITVSLLEGGLTGMIKSLEKSVFEIPCDGSIPENLKVNITGLLYDDVFHFQITSVTLPSGEDSGGDYVLPMTLVSNDGDNIGVTKNSPSLEHITGDYFQRSANCALSFDTPTYYKLKGTITVKSDPSIHNTAFNMYTATNKSVVVAGGLSNAMGLVGPGKYDPSDGAWVANSQHLDGQKLFSFEVSGLLDAGEKLFVNIFNNFGAFPTTIVGGNLDATFASQYKHSRAVGITMWDLFRLIMKNMYAKHLAIGGQPFNYDVQSSLLQENLGIVCASGDALRASTDPNYFQYYNQATLNPANPNNQDYNQFPSLGPVIKANLSDHFDTTTALKNAALGVRRVGNKDVVFIEKKSYVMDPSIITMSLSKVSNLKVSVALDYYFNWVKAGYEEQNYDEKAGKFEYNAPNEWQAPIRSIAKVLELISKYRADSRGIDLTRYNTQGGKSSTYNASDNSIFMMGVNFASFIRDFYSASFKAFAPNPASSANDDQLLIAKQAYQPITMITLDGADFVMDIDFAIFMFNQDIAPAVRDNHVVFDALLNGLPGDSATIKMYRNGVVVKTWQQVITGINTLFHVDEHFNLTYGPGDNFYFSIDTSGTCTTEITFFEIDIDSGYFTTTNAGTISIPASSTQKLISLPTITATLVGGLPVVSSGYQYFRFLSHISNRNFDWTYMIAGYTNGGGSEFVRFDLWKNGQKIGTDTFFGQGSIQPFNALKSVLFTGNLTFDLNDIVWMTASPANINVWISDGELKFISQIKAYDLDRPAVAGGGPNSAYDSISGIPHSETAYNIDPFTPARMIRANGSLLSPVIYNQAPGMLSFQTANKNGFLSTTKGGVTITERANIDIHELDPPLFHPFYLEFDTEVPVNFNDLLVGQANGHIEVLWGNKKLYGFPMQVTSKPALNESQTWKLLCSPRTNPADLKDLDWDGLIPLQPMDALIPILGPLHWVPLAYSKDSRYNTFTMQEDWFKNRVADWIENNDFFSPWQWNDVLPFQCQTNGLAPVTIQLLSGDGDYIGDPIVIPSVATSALQSPQTLFQQIISMTDLKTANSLQDDEYYFLWFMGIGEGQAVFISEGITVKDKHPGTVLVEFKHSRNKLGAVFTEGYFPCLRVPKNGGRYTPKARFTEFEDQPADLDLLASIGYDTWKFTVGLLPDYLMQKLDRALLLDTVFIDGTQYTRDAGSNWEQQTFPGEAKVFMSIELRKAKNSDALILNTAGQLTDDMSGGYTIDPAAFGQSLDGQDLLQVTND